MKRLPLILIAGWGFTGKAMLGLKEALKGDEVEITSTAELWRGKSQTGSVHLSGLSRYALALGERLKSYDGRAGVIGCSMGGIVALETARKYPQLIQRLVIIGGTARLCAGNDGPPGVPLTVLRAMSMGLRRTPDAILTAFYKQVHATREMAPANIAKLVMGLGPLNRDELVQGLDYLQQTDLRSGLDKLAVPTFVGHGRQDRIIPWRAGEWLSRQLPRAQWRLYEDQGHALPLLAPAKLAADIRAFLGSHSPNE